jgi:CelD/BcsL family acetyltransferase involved in cellulose biosynthesis
LAIAGIEAPATMNSEPPSESGLPESTRDPASSTARGEPSPSGASVVAARDHESVEARAKDLSELARRAIEPNPFYEPWALVPALRDYARDSSFEFVFISRRDGTLIGFFPLVREERFRGVPVRALALWNHEHCYLNTPLVHAGYARECVNAFLDFLAKEADAPILVFERMTGDGPFAALLISALADRKEHYCSFERHFRGLYTLRSDADTYLASILDGEGRRKLKMKERKLAENGSIEYDVLAPRGDIERWLAEFLTLEASGWKGKEATAMQSSPEGRRYFESVIRAAFDRNQLEMLALRLNGNPIAMKCNLVCGDAGFCFKIAYDERYAKQSPGMLLELNQIRRLHAERTIRWVDSCSSPKSRHFGQVCLDRRTIETLVLSTGRERGRLIVALLPLLQWVTRLARMPMSRTRSLRPAKDAAAPEVARPAFG